MLRQARRLLNLTGDRLAALPLVILYLTDGCNSRCITCDIWRNPRRNMAPALAEQIALACAELGVSWVLLSGGEAMQHPQWQQIASRYRELGVRVMLLTNGLLVRRQVQEIAACVDDLIVSLDGGSAITYEQIRGVDAYDLVLDGIAAARAAGMHVTTRTTVQRMNFREIPAIIRAARDLDVNKISFLPVDIGSGVAFGERDLSNTPGMLDHAEVAALEQILLEVEHDYAVDFASGRIAESPEKLRRILVQYFRALLGDAEFPRPRCNAPHFSTVIEVDGTLRPCYFLPAYGRLKPDGDTLGSAINHDAAQELRKAYRGGMRAECERCVCPLYKGPRELMRM